MFADQRHCLEQLSAEAVGCQSSLSTVGEAVSAMIRGTHGEAHLCRAFYALRRTFECGARAAQLQCPQVAYEATQLEKEVCLFM